MSDRNVSRNRPIAKEDVRRALAADWFGAAQRLGKGVLSDATGASVETINDVISERHAGLPEMHTGLNSLIADPSALFNVLQLFGGVFVPTSGAPVDDFATIRQMMKAASEYLDRMQDNQRCHVDTAVLAKLFKPLVPSMLSIIREANGQEKPDLKAVA